MTTTVEPSYLQVTTVLQGEQWVITATVTENSFLPPFIFAYENTGTTTLGSYVGIVNIEELNRYQEWQGAAIPMFGNRFVRSNQAKITIDFARPDAQTQIQTVIAHLTKIAGQLNVALQSAASSTQIIQV
jgi:hypothetical protein